MSGDIFIDRDQKQDLCRSPKRDGSEHQHQITNKRLGKPRDLAEATRELRRIFTKVHTLYLGPTTKTQAVTGRSYQAVTTSKDMSWPPILVLASTIRLEEKQLK